MLHAQASTPTISVSNPESPSQASSDITTLPSPLESSSTPVASLLTAVSSALTMDPMLPSTSVSSTWSGIMAVSGQVLVVKKPRKQRSDKGVPHVHHSTVAASASNS